MKKIIFLSLSLFLFLPVAVYAASIGGAETLGQGKLGFGLDQEFVFEKEGKTLIQEVSGLSFTRVRSKYEIDKMYRTMMKVSYGLIDNLDVYTRLGRVNPDYKVRSDLIFPDPGLIQEDWKYKGKNAFAYGFGMKGTYSLNNRWLIGVDTQYIRHENNYKATGYYAEYLAGVLIDEGPMPPKKGKVIFCEWHVAPYIAVQLGNFAPYIGARYSDARFKEKHEAGYTTNLKAKDNVGAFIGADLKIDDSWKLNIEGRFVDETAMSVGATYKF